MKSATIAIVTSSALVVAVGGCSHRNVTLIPSPRAALDTISENELGNRCRRAVQASRKSPVDLLGHMDHTRPDSGAYHGLMILRGLKGRNVGRMYGREALEAAHRAPPLVPFTLDLYVGSRQASRRDLRFLTARFDGNFCAYCLNHPRDFPAVELKGDSSARIGETFMRLDSDDHYFDFYLNITQSDSRGLTGVWGIMDGDIPWSSLGVFCAVKD